MKFECEIPVLGNYLEVWYVDSVDEVNAEHPNLNVEGGSVGYCCTSGQYHIVILIKGQADKHTLAHELFHLTHDVLDSRRVVFCKESEEMYAILQGWLYTKIRRWISDNNIRLPYND